MKSFTILIFAVALLAGLPAFCDKAVAAAPSTDLPAFPVPTEVYNDQDVSDLWQRLAGRVKAEPFNLVATVIFFLAICHTFFASNFLSIAHRYEQRYDALLELEAGQPHKSPEQTHAARNLENRARTRPAAL